MNAGNITFVAISVQDYPPGEYNLTIMATDIFGQSVDEDVSLLLPGMMYMDSLCQSRDMVIFILMMMTIIMTMIRAITLLLAHAWGKIWNMVWGRG